LISDYDAIGFDLEHTLVKFNVRAMTKLIVEGHLEDLKTKFAYPAEVEFFDYDDESLNLFLNNAVWDIEHGTVLKLAEGQIITHAVHGIKPMGMDMIKQIYGDPPIFKTLQWPQTYR
jgi:hypothetical protein